jgi:hypothetical protein
MCQIQSGSWTDISGMAGGGLIPDIQLSTRIESIMHTAVIKIFPNVEKE